jgi:photosystem II stability/assembly factor-like uncharacterized protein
MHILRRCPMFFLLVFVLSFGGAVQRNRAADNDIISSYLPLLLREEDSLHSIGPQGGSIVVMEIDPNNTSILYAGTWGSGMYKSVDGGLSWQVINQGLPFLYINSLAIDPQNPLILYAGTYEHGVYKTTDGGATWAATGPGMSPIPIVYTIAVDPVTPNVVYAGTRNQQEGPPWGGGLYKTTNGGETWVKSKLGINEEWVYDITIDPVSPNIIYAATHSKGVFKTVSAGSYWEPVNNGITDLSTRSIVIDPTNTEIVYVGTWHYGGVFKTVNGGSSWKAASSGLYHKIYSLNMDPKNPNIIYAATYRKGIMVTENGGTNWHNTGLYPDMVYNVMIDPRHTSTLFAGTMGDGFYISYDRGENWASSNMGFRAANVTGLAVDWTTSITGTKILTDTGVDAVYTSLYGGGIYKTIDLGQNWQWISSGLGEAWVHSMAMSRTDPQTLYAGTDSTGFFITIDGGVTWTAGNNGLPEPAVIGAAVDGWLDPYLRPDLFEQAFFEGVPDPAPSAEAATKVVSILAIGVDSFDPLKLYIGTQGLGIYRSQNGGVRWYATNLKIHTVYAILSDPFTAGILYAGCDGGSNTLYRSLDGGETWKLKNVGMAGLSVYALAADPAIPGTVYAGTNQGIFKSIDNAETWALFGLPGQVVYALGLSQAAPGTIYAGTYYGLYISSDGGATWEPMNNGLVNTEITHLVMDPTGSPLINFIGVRAGGVYTYGYSIPASK